MERRLVFKNFNDFLPLDTFSDLEIFAKSHEICKLHSFDFIVNLLKCRVFAKRITEFAVIIKHIFEIILTATYRTSKGFLCFSAWLIKLIIMEGNIIGRFFKWRWLVRLYQIRPLSKILDLFALSLFLAGFQFLLVFILKYFFRYSWLNPLIFFCYLSRSICNFSLMLLRLNYEINFFLMVCVPYTLPFLFLV